MRSIRLAVVLILSAVTGTLSAQCVSGVWQIASRNDSTPLVAKTAVWTGNALAVANVQSGTGTIWFTRFDDHGNALGRPVRFSGTLDSEFVDLIWNGSDLGLFYLDSTRKLFYRALSSTGESMTADISLLPTVTFGADDVIDILWDPTRNAYAIGRTVNGADPEVWLTMVDRAGVVKSNRRVASAAAKTLVRVAATESGILGIFFKRGTDDQLWYQRVDGNDLQILRAVSTVDEQFDVIAYDNRFAIVSWENLSNGRQALVYSVVDTAGLGVVAAQRLFIVYETETDQKIPLIFSSRPGELAVAYFDPAGRATPSEAGFRLRRFTFTGATIADTYFAAADLSETKGKTEGHIVWTGSSWMTAVERETPLGSNSYLLRLCPLIAIAPSPVVAHSGTPVTFSGAADGGVPLYSYSWEFSDSVALAGGSVQRVFAAPGVYTGVMTVEDSTHTFSSQSFTITVTDPDPNLSPRRRAVRRFR